MCGIVGVISKEPVNQLIYDALLLLQHRGQDAAGIVTQQGRKFFMHKAKGMVRDIFRTGRLAEDMSLYVHRPSVTDPTVAPEGDDTFYALSPVPHLGHADPVDWAQMAEPYRRKVQAVLEERLLPGLSRHISASKVFTPETFRDRYLSPHGAGFSLEPRILQSAFFRPHNVSEEAKGLYLVGAGTHPGAGLPGVISSAEVLDHLVPDPQMVRQT